MATIKKTATAALARGRDTAVRVGKVAKAAAVVGAKAGASAAIAAGTLEARKGWKETSPETTKKRTRTKIAMALAGVAVVGAAAIGIAKARRKK
jgi:hypothetical protein